jgi:hypothetical protein
MEDWTMLRLERHPKETAPRFEVARSWRAWHEWAGIMGLATGLALWVFLATGVVAPLGDALARLRPPADVAAAPGCVLPVDGTLAPGAQPCVCACPESPPRQSPSWSG